VTRYEMIISLLCLVAGYFAVSWSMDRGRQSGGRKSGGDEAKSAGGGPSPEPGPSRSDEPRREGPARPAPHGTMPWYVVLDVDRSASRAEITAAYRTRISQYHPDKVARMGPEIRALAESKSAEINAAYKVAIESSGRVV
jgi:DnaJ-domain-containing protein 1